MVCCTLHTTCFSNLLKFLQLGIEVIHLLAKLILRRFKLLLQILDLLLLFLDHCVQLAPILVVLGPLVLNLSREMLIKLPCKLLVIALSFFDFLEQALLAQDFVFKLLKGI